MSAPDQTVPAAGGAAHASGPDAGPEENRLAQREGRYPSAAPAAGTGSQGRERAEALAGVVLVAVAMVWGSSFFMTKELLARTTPLDFLAVRFAVAGTVGALVMAKRLRRASRSTWAAGTALGAVYTVSQVLQTWGLDRASASVSGFLTALYVVGTPLVAWLLWRSRPVRSTALAVLLALAGAAVLGLGSMSSGVPFGAGELALLGCAVGYSFHVALLGRWSVGKDALALATIQMLTLGVLHVTLAAVVDGGVSQIILPATPADWVRVLYLAVIVGLLALVGQSWAQGRMDAARAAVIMALEPVFSALFAVLFGGEAATWRLVGGGGLIFAGSVVAELGPLLARRRLREDLGAE